MAAFGWIIARWFVSSQVGQVVGLVLLALAAFGGWTWKVARDADQAAVERALTATKAESTRRLDELAKVKEAAGEQAVALEKLASERAKMQGTIDALSKANDNRSCLDPAGVLRLDALGGRRKAR